MTTSDQILEKLTANIESKGHALVALSGGIDSTLLSYLTHRALGKRVLSYTVVSEFFITGERRYIDLFVERFQISRSYIEVRVREDFIRPSNTCLATRISTSLRIKEETLKMVEEAENYLHGLGFSVVRVRYLTPSRYGAALQGDRFQESCR